MSHSPAEDLARGLQEQQALIGVRDLLVRLSRPELTPRVPLAIRREARALLRHYPHGRSAAGAQP